MLYINSTLFQTQTNILESIYLIFVFLIKKKNNNNLDDTVIDVE